jgi:hypothetical protein
VVLEATLACIRESLTGGKGLELRVAGKYGFTDVVMWLEPYFIWLFDIKGV